MLHALRLSEHHSNGRTNAAGNAPLPGLSQQIHLPHGHLHGAQSRPAAQMAPGGASLGRRRATPVTAELLCFLDLGSYRTAWLMAQRICEALYRRGIEKRARPATLQVVTEGDARNARELSFDDAVQALIACPRKHGTRSNGRRHAGDRNGGEGEISPFVRPLQVERSQSRQAALKRLATAKDAKFGAAQDRQ